MSRPEYKTLPLIDHKQLLVYPDMQIIQFEPEVIGDYLDLLQLKLMKSLEIQGVVQNNILSRALYTLYDINEITRRENSRVLLRENGNGMAFILRYSGSHNDRDHYRGDAAAIEEIMPYIAETPDPRNHNRQRKHYRAVLSAEHFSRGKLDIICGEGWMIESDPEITYPMAIDRDHFRPLILPDEFKNEGYKTRQLVEADFGRHILRFLSKHYEHSSLTKKKLPPKSGMDLQNQALHVGLFSKENLLLAMSGADKVTDLGELGKMIVVSDTATRIQFRGWHLSAYAASEVLSALFDQFPEAVVVLDAIRGESVGVFNMIGAEKVGGADAWCHWVRTKDIKMNNALDFFRKLARAKYK